jgi:hypothetical protein
MQTAIGFVNILSSDHQLFFSKSSIFCYDE